MYASHNTRTGRPCWKTLIGPIQTDRQIQTDADRYRQIQTEGRTNWWIDLFDHQSIAGIITPSRPIMWANRSGYQDMLSNHKNPTWKTEASIPPEAMMHFPLFHISPPLFPKNFSDSVEKFPNFTFS